jgi:NAD(P)-dependent dehydrogenase (short-subunit alcohol dehydrogenase family)
LATFLVTGASSGIGESVALRLDGLGHQVFAGVRTAEAGEELRSSASERLRPLIMDVTDADQVRSAVAGVDVEVGPDGLDGLVNNAGIAIGGPVEFLPLSEWQRQFDVNVLGQVAVTQAALPAIRRARGRVVFIGSISGRVSTPFGAPYGASKHAIEAIGQSLREEVHPWGIRVSVVAPGLVRTPIWDKGLVSADRVIESLPSEGVRLYGEAVKRLRTQIQEIGSKASTTPERVSEAVEHALLNSRPKHRYLPGLDAKVVATASWLLPDRALAALLRLAGP